MKSWISILAGAAVLAAAGAPAATTSYGLSAGIGQSDNIARTPADEQSETLASAGLDFSIAEPSGRLRGTAAADLAYIEYLDDTYDSEVVGNLDGRAVFSVIPERFEWFLQDTFGQVRQDPFQPVTPANRENINYFTTGPDLILQFGSLNRMRVAGRYSNVRYEDSPFDNDRLGGSFSFLRNLSSATVLSANVQTEQVEYDSNLAGSDYDRHSAFLGYATEGGRTRLNADLGYSKLSRSDSGIEDSKGLLARLDLRRQLTAASSLALRVGREFTNADDTFRLLQGFSVLNLETQPVLQTADPFTNKYASLGWDFSARRTGLGVSVTRFDEEHQQPILDRKRTLASAHAYRDLLPNLRVQVGGTVAKENFVVPNEDFRETTAAVLLAWQATRKLTFSLQYDRTARDADNGISDYRENRGWLQLRYGVGAPASMSAPPSWQTIPTPPAGDG